MPNGAHHRCDDPWSEARVDEIQISDLGWVNRAVVSKELQFAPGDKVHQNEVTRDALKIFGQGYFESVDYEMLNQRDRNILRLLPRREGLGTGLPALRPEPGHRFTARRPGLRHPGRLPEDI
jgi:hypothetical protein